MKEIGIQRLVIYASIHDNISNTKDIGMKLVFRDHIHQNQFMLMRLYISFLSPNVRTYGHIRIKIKYEFVPNQPYLISRINNSLLRFIIFSSQTNRILRIKFEPKYSIHRTVFFQFYLIENSFFFYNLILFLDRNVF